MENKVEIMETRLHAMEIQKTLEGEADTIENTKLKDRIKELEEKVNHNLTLDNIESKIYIKHIKEEMKKLVALDHWCSKRDLSLIIFGLKDEEEEDMLGKLIENKERLIRVKVRSTKQKYNILNKTSSLKGSGIFVNEDFILKDRVELRKEVQKVKKI